MALTEEAEIGGKTTAKEQELQAVRRTAQLQLRTGLTAITVPIFPAAFAELLAKTFADVSAHAERRVTEHMAGHPTQARGEMWLSEGLTYVNKGKKLRYAFCITTAKALIRYSTSAVCLRLRKMKVAGESS